MLLVSMLVKITLCLSPFISDIEPDFKKQLHKLVPMMLASENLVVKEIAGQKVKAKELLQYFKSYLEIYKGDELPEPKSMLVVSFCLLLCFSLIFICCYGFNLLYIVCMYVCH